MNNEHEHPEHQRHERRTEQVAEQVAEQGQGAQALDGEALDLDQLDLDLDQLALDLDGLDLGDGPAEDRHGEASRPVGLPRDRAMRGVRRGAPIVSDPADTPIESPAPASVPEAPQLPPAAGPKPRRGRRPRSEPRKVGRPSNHDQRAERVTALYAQLGDLSQFAMVAGAPGLRIASVGSVVSANAEPIGEAWATWADTSDRVARLIDGLSFGGGALGVLLAHVPIVLALVNPAPLDPEAMAFAEAMRANLGLGGEAWVPAPDPNPADGAPRPG